MFAKLGFGAIASAAAGMVMMGSAHAITFNVTFLGDENSDPVALAAAAAAIEAAFLSQGTLLAFEDFEPDGAGITFVAGQTANFFDTDVGTFTSGDAEKDLIIGAIGTCADVSCGRVPVSGENWLDNGDASDVLWEVSPFPGNNAVAFFTVDPSDQGGITTVTATNGDSVSFSHPDIVNSPDGGLYYIEVYDASGIMSVSYSVVDETGTVQDADGWGVDNVAVLLVPEPATLGLFGAGLLGLGLYRRRRAA